MGSQWFNFKAPWLKQGQQYQSLDTLYSDKENIRWYWRLIAQIATYMILGGYLILPTTFDSDPQLRFNKGVLAIIIVALLTGGYSLTGLVWFACPSRLFRLDHIFLPVFSVSLFAFFACCYALAASPRYKFSEPSAPATLALTLASALVYGVLALMLQKAMRKMPRTYEAQNIPNAPSLNPVYQDAGFQQNFVPGMQRAARSPGSVYEPYGSPSPHPTSFDGGSTMTRRQPSEEELVNQQMAKLLTRQDLGLTENASRSTFHLDWPPGAEEPEHELDGSSGRRRQSSFGDAGGLLAPSPAGRKRSMSADNHAGSGGGGAWSKITRAVGAERPSSRHQRQRSRDERRREIEMNALPSN